MGMSANMKMTLPDILICPASNSSTMKSRQLTVHIFFFFLAEDEKVTKIIGGR